MTARMVVALDVPDDWSINEVADLINDAGHQAFGATPDATVWPTVDDLVADLNDGREI